MVPLQPGRTDLPRKGSKAGVRNGWYGAWGRSWVLAMSGLPLGPGPGREDRLGCVIQDRGGSEVEERTQVPLWPLLFDIFMTLEKLPNAPVMWGLLLPFMLYVPGPECEEGFWQLGNYSHPTLSLWAPAQARALLEGQKAASPVAFLESQFPQPGARVDLDLSPDHPRPWVSSGEGFLEVP